MILLLMGVCGTGKSTIGQRLSEKLQWPFEDGDHYHPASNKAKMSSGKPLSDEDRYEWLMNLHQVIHKWHISNQHGIVVCSALKVKYRQVLLWGSKARYNFNRNSGTRNNTKVQSGFQSSDDGKSHRQIVGEVNFQSRNVEYKDDKACQGCQLLVEQKKSPSYHIDTLEGQRSMPHEGRHQPSVDQYGEQPGVLFVHLKGSFDIIASRLSLRKGHFFNPTLLQSQFDTLEDLEANENGIVINIENSEDHVVTDIVECLSHHNLKYSTDVQFKSF